MWLLWVGVISVTFVLEVSGNVNSEFVTCGSLLKLRNIQVNSRLHSHDVKYGSGSGQQSVTGECVVPQYRDPII